MSAPDSPWLDVAGTVVELVVMVELVAVVLLTELLVLDIMLSLAELEVDGKSVLELVAGGLKVVAL